MKKVRRNGKANAEDIGKGIRGGGGDTNKRAVYLFMTLPNNC